MAEPVFEGSSMNRFVLAALLGATALTAGAGVPAIAQTTPPAATRDAPPEPRGGGMRGGWLMRADANGDGVVTRDEVIADADRRFTARDSDRDGKVSRDEQRAARDTRRGPPSPGADGMVPPPPPPGAADAPSPSDARGDDHPRRAMRPQTRDQARERALRMFDRADANHDGRVDAQEIEAMRLLMRARFAGSGDGDRRGSLPGDEQR
jgi:hypothetical protein